MKYNALSWISTVIFQSVLKSVLTEVEITPVIVKASFNQLELPLHTPMILNKQC